MANYYFLITAFPPLSCEMKLEMSFKDLKEILLLNLSAKDFHEVERILRPIDLYNIKAFWLGLPLDERGNFREKDLEEELLVQGALPAYLIDYLARYDSTQDRLRYFSSLYASLYKEESEKLKGFSKCYYVLGREVRLCLAALRAKRQGRDIVRELQFEDPTDPFVAQILAQKDALSYSPPQEYEELKNLFIENSLDPVKLDRAVLQFQFDRIEQMEEIQDFGIDRILNYVARFLIVESLAHLNQKQGMATVEQLSQYE